MGLFDDAFRKVFSDKRIFVELINHFAPDIGLPKLKEENLTLEDTVFKDPYFSNRQSDLLYRVTYGRNEVYIYLLMEHQSRVDFLMAFRILGYMVRIWEHYIEDHRDIARRKRFKLPPIIPIVFYDGVEKWTATQYFNEKVNNWEYFKRFTPMFMYELIDVNEIDKTKIENTKIAVSVLLRLNSAKKEEAVKVVEALRGIIKSLPEKERELLTQHISAYLMVLARKTGMEIEEEYTREDGEVVEMFERFERSLKGYIKEEREKAIREGLQQGIEKGLQQGIQQGKIEGKVEGIAEGIAEGILLAIEIKFGEKVKKKTEQYILNMDITQLKKMKDIVKEVKTPEELTEKIKYLKH